VYSSGIAELIESDGEEFNEEFIEALEEARRQKANLTAMLEHVRGGLEGSRPFSTSHPALAETWRTQACAIAEQLADRAGVSDRCQMRGLGNLLEVPAVRVTIALVLAVCAQAESGDPASRRPNLNSVHHALSAAATGGILVTADGGLQTTLTSLTAAGLMPDRVEVIDLAALLGRIAAAH